MGYFVIVKNEKTGKINIVSYFNDHTEAWSEMESLCDKYGISCVWVESDEYKDERPYNDCSYIDITG